MHFKKQWSSKKWNIIIKRRISERETQTTIYSLNPFHYIKRFIHNINWFFTEKYYKFKNEEYKICQGGGEGISLYRITDPNEKANSKKKFNCCKNCVNFYDAHWSAQEIIGYNVKYKYQNGKKIINKVHTITKNNKTFGKKNYESFKKKITKFKKELKKN